MTWFVIVLLLLAVITVFFLRGENLAPFDMPPGQSFDAGHGSNEEHDAALASFAVGMGPIQRAPRRQRLPLMREYMDSISDSQDFEAQITPADAGGVPAEWVLAPGANPDRRVLYIHGGAFVMGSPKSHRNISSRFSAVANAAVLVIDYRLMPEHRRIAGVEDCRTAYQWLLDNGPQGREPAQRLFVGGDSAGGNLALSLICWVRDQPLRQPDAAVAFSPITDSTFSAPSLQRNLATDAMLGPMFKGLTRVPRPLIWWAFLIQNRCSPNNPVVSPVFGDLAGLPPTLVHASESEVLCDDARRFVNRAVAAGSPAKLQTWPHVMHVWQMFYPQLSEARSAWDEVGAFIAQVEAESSSLEAVA